MNRSELGRKNLELMELFTQELLGNEKLAQQARKAGKVCFFPTP